MSEAAKPYQVMPDTSKEVFDSLREDIKENGVEEPVHIDENGDVIDGHHRVEICDDLGIDGYPTKIHAGLSDQEKRDLAYKLNLQRRHLEAGEKQEIAKKYLLEDWDGGESQKSVAQRLGVSEYTVSEAKKELEDGGKEFGAKSFPKSDKRRQVRDYIDGNPDASNREVEDAIEADVSYKTIGNWRNEWEDEDSEEEEQSEPEDTELTPTFSTFSPTGDTEDVEKTKELFEEAKEGNDEAKEQVNRVSEGKASLDTASRRVEQKKREEETPDLEAPDGEYSVILADPPWQYDFSKSSTRDVENQYSTMTLSDIKDLEVPAADDSVLYMWAVAPKIPEAVAVMDAWGFEYKTCAVWDKEKIGMGYWFRGQHELLMVGTRGSVSPPDTDARVSSVIRKERGKHSEKPEVVHEIVEDAFPNADRVELFARDGRDGWDVWGAEA